MAAFVIPHHQATLNEMDRIVAAADSHASVLEILNAGPAKIISEVKRAYIKLAARVHSHRGGNFSKERAEQAFVIVARSWEQVKRTAEYKLLHKRGCIYEPFFDPAFDVPGILWFSRQESEEEAELLKAQQDIDEAEESGLEAAAAAAAAAACAAADEGTGGDSASSDDEDPCARVERACSTARRADPCAVDRARRQVQEHHRGSPETRSRGTWAAWQTPR